MIQCFRHASPVRRNHIIYDYVFLLFFFLEEIVFKTNNEVNFPKSKLLLLFLCSRLLNGNFYSFQHDVAFIYQKKMKLLYDTLMQLVAAFGNYSN